MCGFSAVHAQSFYNQGSTVSVISGTIFSVKDSLVNTGTFINNGNLVIGGSWLNTGTYSPGVGEITFNSSSATLPQIINHSNQSFSKLTISGGGKKLILADITIEDEMILSEGIIEAENDARVIINATATVSAGSDAAHINAPVYHHGSGQKVYPLGNGSVYLPVTLSGITDAQSFVGIHAVELSESMLPKAPSLDAISSTRYWRLDPGAGPLNFQITLPLREETLPGDLPNVVVTQSPSLNERFESIGQSSSTGTLSEGFVTSERQVTAPYVALASTSDDGSLQVYNALSSNNDGLNDFVRILNIENYPENKFTLFNRWGDKIFELDNYDNKERVFRGKSNVNGERDLVNGTYFYVLETSKERLRVNGFIVLKN
jgi:gliding motility-associated-like protein